MKKYIYIIIIIGSFGLTNCEDAIDITQVGRLGADEAFESVDDLEQGLLGVYNQFDYSPAIQFNAVFTDEVSIGFDNGGQGLGNGEYGFRLNPQSDAPEAIWVNYYDALNFATRLIESALLVEVPADDEGQTRYNNILGQAYALRAWAHFELLSYFSPDMTDANALGVILLNFIPSVDDELTRNTNGEIYASIENDLAQAATLITVQSDPTFVSLDFVKALRARIAAYRRDYSTADQLAAELLNDYPIADQDQYRAMFEDDDNTEIIFKLERSIGDAYDGQGATGSGFAGGWVGANFAFVNATVDGSPYFEMSNSLFNLLDPNDVRYDVLVEPSSDIPQNILAIGKYRGSSGQPLMNDLKIFRSSEMLLIRAEAAADANDLAAAAGFIDDLRDARFGADQTAPVYGSQTAAFAGILEERRIELAYEGFRWMDLRRLGERAGIQGIQRDPTDCAINGACNLNIDDYRFTMPIPLVELNANDNIQQNDQY